MEKCDNTNCIKNGLPTCDRWDDYATHCFEAKPTQVTEAPKKPTPSGQAESAGSATLTADIMNMDKAISALYLELPQTIMDDVAQKWHGVRNHLRK